MFALQAGEEPGKDKRLSILLWLCLLVHTQLEEWLKTKPSSQHTALLKKRDFITKDKGRRDRQEVPVLVCQIRISPALFLSLLSGAVVPNLPSAVTL